MRSDIENTVGQVSQLTDTFATNSAHNLLPTPRIEQQAEGLTILINPDGSITFSGSTGQDNAVLLFARYNYNADAIYALAGKQVIISGGLSYQVYLQLWNATEGRAYVFNNVDGELFTMPDLRNTEWSFTLYITHGYSSDNPVTIYPMIRLATDTSSIYAPYAMTNRELTNSTVKKEYYELSDSNIHNIQDVRRSDIIFIVRKTSNGDQAYVGMIDLTDSLVEIVNKGADLINTISYTYSTSTLTVKLISSATVVVLKNGYTP